MTEPSDHLIMQPSQLARAILEVSRGINEKEVQEMVLLCRVMKDITEREIEEIGNDFDSFVSFLKVKDLLSADNPLFFFELLDGIGRKDLAKLFNPYETFTNNHGNLGHGYDGQMRATGAPRTYRQQNGTAQSSHGQSQGAVHVPPMEEIMGEDLQEVFHAVVEYIGRDWRYLARRLGISEFELDDITEKHPRSLRDQVYTMLLRWKTLNQKRATRQELIRGLRLCRMNLAADVIESLNCP